MKCLECGGIFKELTNTHLKRCSSLTVKEYKTKHNIKIVCDEEVRMKSVGENNPNYKDGNTYTKVSCNICGTKITGRGKTGLCKNCAMIGTINPFFGKRHTIETRNKMKESNKDRDKSTYKGGSTFPNYNISNRQKKYWKTMDYDEKILRLTTFIEAGNKACKKNKNTKIEQIAYNFLKKYKDIKQNIKIDGTPYYVDFLIPSFNLIIECYGDYWHCNPSIYKESFFNKSIKMFAKEKWEKDLKRLKSFNRLGYKTIVVWENEDIQKKLEQIMNNF
jgi:G:T-mismatch repair DNA endonuclease (very short patch repair protein)